MASSLRIAGAAVLLLLLGFPVASGTPWTLGLPGTLPADVGPCHVELTYPGVTYWLACESEGLSVGPCRAGVLSTDGGLHVEFLTCDV
jgi:hypothetical protein